MLFQKETLHGKEVYYPLSFFSLKFTPTQQNYSTVERELFAVLNTLEHARLMLPPEITIYTDNRGIISIGNTSRDTHPRFAKFLDLLNVYRLHWKHLPGHKNVIADYLSRFGLDSQPELDITRWDKLATEVSLQAMGLDDSTSPHPAATGLPHNRSFRPLESNAETSPLPLPSDVDDTIPTSESPEEPLIRNMNDLSWPDIVLIKEHLTTRSSDIPHRLSDIINFFHLVDDILYAVRGNVLNRVVIDSDYYHVARHRHRQFHATHRVLQLMLQGENLWNSNSAILTLDVVRHCQKCEVYEKFRDLPAELPPIKPTPLFTRWHLDFAGPFPTSNS